MIEKMLKKTDYNDNNNTVEPLQRPPWGQKKVTIVERWPLARSVDCIHVDDHDNDYDHTKRDLRLETCNLPLISRKTSTAIGESGSTSPGSLSIKP